MTDGINNLVAAISSRILQSQLDKDQAMGQQSAKASFAPLIEALKKRETPTADKVAAALSNPWINPGQRSIAERLSKQ
jgi:hypothetical protein